MGGRYKHRTRAGENNPAFIVSRITTGNGHGVHLETIGTPCSRARGNNLASRAGEKH